MSLFTTAYTVHITLSAHGDALIYGTLGTDSYLPGLVLKQRLFAWHEPSYYGTELEVRQVQEAEVIILPSEQVIPFLAQRELLEHIEWEWGQDESGIVRLAPALAACIEERKYLPSFSAFRAGRLEWIWDAEALKAGLQAELKGIGTDEALTAAFSAAVFSRWYGTAEEAADLRREYPQLFASNGAASAWDAPSWLVAIGWKADSAPFRPLLQLLEPDDEEWQWRLRLVLQDKLDPASLVPIQLGEDGQAAGEWPDRWTGHVRDRSPAWLAGLRANLAGEQLSGGGDGGVLGKPLSDEAAWRFLTADSRRLLEAGWQVLLPAWWEAASRKKPRLRAKLRSEERDSQGKSLFGLDSIISFDWRIAVGDADLTEEEFAELSARNERLVRFRDQWITLDPALLEQIRRIMEGVDSSQGLSFQDVLHLHLLENEEQPRRYGPKRQEPDKDDEPVKLEVELDGYLQQLLSRLERRTEGPQPSVPVGLQAELRSYQLEGYSWLAFLRQLGLGACLADDMGLGKTIQFITYLLHLRETAEPNTALPALLICPTSVLGNWQKELSRFAPSLQVMLHYGSRRSGGEAFAEQIRQADIVLTTYATATLDQELLQSFTWESICLDEAQNIKNAQTKQSAAVRSLSARHRIALTGTPVENRLAELWSIYDFINPGYLGSLKGFTTRFIQPIEKDHDEQRTQDLQRLVKPFMLRRKKKDPAIQLDLPDKNEMKTYIHLTPEQSALYDQTVQQLMERMKELEGMERKGAILSALTQLKQLCDHPVLFTKETVQEQEPAGGGESGDTASLISRSSKLERLVAMVKELREEGERCLIFTQYIGMGVMLQSVLGQELQESVLYLNGGTSKTARDRMIEQFQSHDLPAKEQPNVFILSIKAGGVGLNLTAANHVFHFDRWWNPAVENQATDRAYRMGQTKDVQVYKFIALGTLEERIDEMLESKQQLSDQVISSTEGWITELSNEELQDLFTLRREWTAD
ncbi:DEAD/DEAH box helicase [Paenibacillus sp. P96]|uniref:DEAD/DEAH box helicase n=1 Tax=Paenibacillus zeirhizosphaerae TaxID=2987519 RepID=A0ABT9FXE8_9BACL|nr:DEAD/DEAH box helicase [Paenibacillus sp. P96]MDP4099360.1 DEAD/DEAH box helicase [Paenibacillus sp. P96]